MIDRRNTRRHRVGRQARRQARRKARKARSATEAVAKAPGQVVRGVGKALNPFTAPGRLLRGARTLLGQDD